MLTFKRKDSTVPAKKRSSRQRKKSFTSKIMSWPKPMIVALLFGFVGVSYFLFQTFAASNTVHYWGSLTSKNPSAKYTLTTGSGSMKVNFSNNTADAVLTVRNSSGAVVGMLKSIGKRDVLLSVPVTAGTYTFTVDTNAAFRMNKGYSIYITYPLTDLAKPSAVITAPITDQIVKGTVDFSATARDDTAVTKVEFYVDGTLLGTDTTAGYGIKWDTTVVANGLHNLAVKSYDAEGNVGSATGVVTVSNTVAQLPGDGGTAGARFPGDPNPRVTGKAYWGLNGTRAGEHESATGKSSSIHRTFANAWGKTSQLVSNIKEDHSKNRLPWVSIKTPGWGTLASGSRDGEIDTMLRSLDSAAAGKPVWLTVHHEFEGDTTTTGEYTRANYKAMQTKIRQRMTAVGTKNIAFMPIYVGYSWADVTRFNPQDWYVEGILRGRV